MRFGMLQLHAVLCRWAKADGVIGKIYLPKSPLDALSATGILAGFGADFMTTHAFGRGTVAVLVIWIDAVAQAGAGSSWMRDVSTSQALARQITAGCMQLNPFCTW